MLFDWVLDKFPEVFVDLIRLSIEPFEYFIHAEKRIFWVYLLSSFVLGFYYLHRKYKSETALNLLKHVINFPAYFTASSRLDIKLLFANHVLSALVFLPVLGGQFALILLLHRSYFTVFGDAPNIEISLSLVMIVFTFCIFVAEDFSRFIVHYAMHKIPFLWRIHRVHHSAEVLTPLTLYRFHPIETFLLACRKIIVIAFVSSVFLYIFNGRVSVIELMGVNVLSVAFSLVGANLRHSHIPLSFGFLEVLFVSPAQHQIHHSKAPQHFDKNFGTCLALWDRLFKSWYAAEKNQSIDFGVVDYQSHHSFIASLREPFYR